jgi:hypothetical protein
MAPACYARADRGSAGGSARQARTCRVSLVEPGDGAGVAPLGPLRGPRPSGSRRRRGGRRCGHHRPHLTQGPSGRRRGHVRGAAGAAATRRYPAARPPCGGPMAAWITPAHRSYLRWQWLPSTPPSAHGTQLRSPSTPGPKLVGSNTGRAPGRRPPSDALPGSLGGPLGMLRSRVRTAKHRWPIAVRWGRARARSCQETPATRRMVGHVRSEPCWPRPGQRAGHRTWLPTLFPSWWCLARRIGRSVAAEGLRTELSPR